MQDIPPYAPSFGRSLLLSLLVMLVSQPAAFVLMSMTRKSVSFDSGVTLLFLPMACLAVYGLVLGNMAYVAGAAIFVVVFPVVLGFIGLLALGGMRN